MKQETTTPVEPIRLVRPDETWEAQVMDYRREFLECGDSMDGTANLQHTASFSAWLCAVRENAAEETVSPGLVPETILLGVRVRDNCLIGMIGIRHRLNARLLETGGHIGYSVRASERHQGYATVMLGLALEVCRRMGLPCVLLTCDKRNLASAKTMLKHGAVLENEVTQADGKLVQRYWVGLNQPDWNTIKCLKTRRSVRAFSDTPIPRALLAALIETASFAPSWKNTQTVRYIAVESVETRRALAEHAFCGFAPNAAIAEKAPVLLLLTSMKQRSGYERDGSFSTCKGAHWESFDAGVAAQTLCLAAHAYGVSSVILGIFDAACAAEIVPLPENQTLSAIIALGWAATPQQQEAPLRKSVDALLSYASISETNR